jgi:3-oxoacyl-[acyl-carrier-protein] synthase II
MKRVVITGLGLLTSIGSRVDEVWTNLLAAKSGIQKITSFDVENLPCKIAGFISNDENSPNYFNIDKHLEKKKINRNDRFIQYGMIAADFAIKDSGIDNFNEQQKLRIGVSVGSGIGGLETIQNNTIILEEKGPKRISPFFVPAALINLLSGQISIKHGFKGPNHSVVTACATGAHSIGDAAAPLLIISAASPIE